MSTGTAAFADAAWQAATASRLHAVTVRLQALAARAGWPSVGANAPSVTVAN